MGLEHLSVKTLKQAVKLAEQRDEVIAQIAAVDAELRSLLGGDDEGGGGDGGGGGKRRGPKPGRKPKRKAAVKKTRAARKPYKTRKPAEAAPEKGTSEAEKGHPEAEVPEKRKRGRPRKVVAVPAMEIVPAAPKAKRGRPRKVAAEVAAEVHATEPTKVKRGRKPKAVVASPIIKKKMAKASGKLEAPPAEEPTVVPEPEEAAVEEPSQA